MVDKFEVLDEINKECKRFNAQGTRLKIRPDDGDTDPITHFESCVNALFDGVLNNVNDMVGVVIQNELLKIIKKINPEDSVLDPKIGYPQRLYGVYLKRVHTERQD
jgi:hypothetical protein